MTTTLSYAAGEEPATLNSDSEYGAEAGMTAGAPLPSGESPGTGKDPFRGPGPVPAWAYGALFGGGLLVVTGLVLQTYWLMAGSNALVPIGGVPLIAGLILLFTGRRERNRAVADE